MAVPQIGGRDEEKKQSKAKAEEGPDIFHPSVTKLRENIAILDEFKLKLEAYSKEWKVAMVHGRLTADKKEGPQGLLNRGGQCPACDHSNRGEGLAESGDFLLARALSDIGGHAACQDH